MRRFSAILVAVLACLAPTPTGAWADSSGGTNNVVNVSTTSDGQHRARSGLQTAQIGGPTVTSTNLANARTTNCTGCRSVAVAIQAVFATGDVNTFSPTNAAFATNAGGSGNLAFAYANQYAFTTPGPVHLSPEGRDKIQGFREEFASAADSALDIKSKDEADQVTARLDELFWCGSSDIPESVTDNPDSGRFFSCNGRDTGFKAVIDSELVHAGYHVTGAVHRQVKVAGPSSTDTAPSDTTTSSAPTTDQTSGTDSGTSTSGSDTTGSDTSGSDTSGSDTSGSDTSGSDTSSTSGTDQTSGSDSASTDQQSSTSTP